MLVAISIPIFNAQLEKSREATDVANLRNAYAEISAKELDTNTSYCKKIDAVSTGAFDKIDQNQTKIGNKVINSSISVDSTKKELWIYVDSSNGSVEIQTTQKPEWTLLPNS